MIGVLPSPPPSSLKPPPLLHPYAHSHPPSSPEHQLPPHPHPYVVYASCLMTRQPLDMKLVQSCQATGTPTRPPSSTSNPTQPRTPRPLTPAILNTSQPIARLLAIPSSQRVYTHTAASYQTARTSHNHGYAPRTRHDRGHQDRTPRQHSTRRNQSRM